MALVHTQNLSFAYPGKEKKTLDNVSLTIEKGEYVVLCGRSGSGKTTFLRHLKSVLTPNGRRSGSIYFDGRLLSGLDAGEQARRIGFVMQSTEDQLVTDEVWHELAFGLESLGMDEPAMRLRVAEMASFFGMEGWFHRNVGELSGGQKQLLNLASILAMEPELLILDEPASQLDPIAAGNFLDTVRRVHQELGTTVIITEHRLEDIFPAADRVIVMEDGHIAAQGSPASVSEALWRGKMPMFSALPTPVRAFWQAVGDGRPPLTVREGRRWLTEAFPNRPAVTALPENVSRFSETDAAVCVRDIWFRYERNAPDVLKGVTLTIPRGCLYAMVGGNGTGKSTLLKTLCGVCTPYRGRVQLFGRSLRHIPKGELYRGCVSMLPQDPRELFAHQTLREELEEMGADAERTRDIAALCRVEALLDAHPYDLSGGEQQRGALAKVLLTGPKLLLLDEPTKGMDSTFKAEFAALLRELTRRGTTVVLVSHDIEFCAEHADLVGMLFDGGLLTQDIPRRFFSRNSFYTTAAGRMSRGVFQNAVTAADVALLYMENKGGRE